MSASSMVTAAMAAAAVGSDRRDGSIEGAPAGALGWRSCASVASTTYNPFIKVSWKPKGLEDEDELGNACVNVNALNLATIG